MLDFEGSHHEVRYEPAESRSGLFGGNSNWRGPVWFPLNYLLIEALQKFHHYYGDDFTVEAPTGSGRHLTLDGIANELARRLTHIFVRDTAGRRAVFGADERAQTDPQWRDNIPFFEDFDRDTRAGLRGHPPTGRAAPGAEALHPPAKRGGGTPKPPPPPPHNRPPLPPPPP